MPDAILELMALPDPEAVTDGQSRGADCVWCESSPLNTETAVDLGQQKDPEGFVWFPRACRPCAANQAHRALFEHAPMCEQCVDEAGRCESSLALYRLVRQRQ